MSSAFQPDAFQGDAFQAGAPQPPTITVDELIPRAAAAIVSTIAISGWVFAGTPTAASFVNYDSIQPPIRAAKPVQRIYEDTYYRFATNPQSVIATDTNARPRSMPPAPIRTDPYVYVAPLAGATPDYGWTPQVARLPVKLKPPIIVPSWDYGAIPVTPPIVISELIPYQAAGVSSVIVLPSSVYIPAAAAPATYPIALKEPERPQPPRPRFEWRLDQMGTVGVAFYMPQYDFGWADSPRLPIRKSSSPRFAADPYMPAVIPPTYDYGWASTARPRLQWPQSSRRDADPYMPSVVTATYDYGWKDIPRLPTQLKPSNARLLPPDLFWYFTGRVADFSWKMEPQKPVQLKPSNARNLAPDLYARFTGGVTDWSWYLEPRKPRPAGPSTARVLGPDPFIIIPGRTPDYGWFARPKMPVPPIPPRGATAYLDYFPWFVLNIMEPMHRTSTQVLYLPYTTAHVLPYSTHWIGLPYETEEG